MTPERKVRQQIDAQIPVSGWAVQDFKAVNFSARRGIALREVPLITGPCDCLLLMDRKAVGVIKAKREGTTLSTVADQSARYVNSLPDFLSAGLTRKIPFLYESTGVETFFRDERDPGPRSRRAFIFRRPETLAEWTAEPDTLRRRLSNMPFANCRQGRNPRRRHCPPLPQSLRQGQRLLQKITYKFCNPEKRRNEKSENLIQEPSGVKL